MTFISARDLAQREHLTVGRVCLLLKAGRVAGAFRLGSGLRSPWVIPSDAVLLRYSPGRRRKAA
jgi:hypothetical protein